VLLSTIRSLAEKFFEKNVANTKQLNVYALYNMLFTS